MLPDTTDVLIVGAGPVGLTAAVSLVSNGHDVVLVDKEAEQAKTSRAAVVYSRTLEVLAPYAIAGRLAARGIHAPRFTIRDRDDVLMSIPFDRLPTAFNYTLLVSQAVTETVLAERLAELGGRVLRPCALVGLDQDGEGVVARFAGGERIRAKYLVGADGTHSTVRREAGIRFAGGGSGDSFSLADLRLSGGVPDDEVAVYFSPAGHLVTVPLPGGIHRVVAYVSEAPEQPDAPFFQQLLDTRGPQSDPAVVQEVAWGSRFRVNHGVVDDYRSGRVLLAGDAAHQHSPLGGQGMNTGITDAAALGRTLSEVLDGGPAELLDVYGAAQRPVAEEVVSLTATLTRLATLKGWMRPARNLALTLSSPFIRRRTAWRLSLLVHRPRQDRILSG